MNGARQSSAPSGTRMRASVSPDEGPDAGAEAFIEAFVEEAVECVALDIGEGTFCRNPSQNARGRFTLRKARARPLLLPLRP